MRNTRAPELRSLSDAECLFYRGQLHAARYAALADAEAFSDVCFALEALGLRLLGKQGDLNRYEKRIYEYAQKSPIFDRFAKEAQFQFKTFDALYRIVRMARNDAIHIGAYARHATEAAIELCIVLEEGVMMGAKRTVGNMMVKSPITVEPWQPVAHARQLMLMHSFSFLPVRFQERWWLVSELGLAKFLKVKSEIKFQRLGMTVEDAGKEMGLIPVPEEQLLSALSPVEDILNNARAEAGPTLWLVVDRNRPDFLAGILSPFELM